MRVEKGVHSTGLVHTALVHEERVAFENGNGVTLIGVLALVNKHAPAVLFCHGLGSSKDTGLLRGFQQGLALHGISTFRFDFYGHGESDGRFERITLSEGVRDVKAAFASLRHRLPSVPIALVGSSFGGAALFYAVPDLDAAALALISPALHYKEVEDRLLGRKGLEAWRQNGFTPFTTYAGRKMKLAYSFYEDLEQYTPESVTPEIPLAFFHGTKDEVVPVEGSRKLAKKLGARIVTYRGVDHNYTRDGAKDTLITDVIDFLVEHLAVKPGETHGHVL